MPLFCPEFLNSFKADASPALLQQSRYNLLTLHLRVLVAGEEIASFHHLPVLVAKPSQALPLIHVQWLEEEVKRGTKCPTPHRVHLHLPLLV